MLKNEVSGLHLGTNLGAKLASGGLRGPLGRHLGSRSLPGRPPKRSRSPPGSKKNDCYLPGGLRRNFLARFHPPRGSRGPLWPPLWEPPGLILALLLATGVETAKIAQQSKHVCLFFLFLGGKFMLFMILCCLPCCAPGGLANIEKS